MQLQAVFGPAPTAAHKNQRPDVVSRDTVRNVHGVQMLLALLISTPTNAHAT